MSGCDIRPQELYLEMTKRTVDDLGDKILKWLEKWKRVLGLTAWVITVRFNLREGYGEATVDDNMPQYESARLAFNTRLMRSEKATDNEIEACVLHELIHLLLWDLVGEHANDAEEEQEDRIVQRLTRALIPS